MAREFGGEFLGQRAVAPIALRAIARGELGREWDDAVKHAPASHLARGQVRCRPIRTNFLGPASDSVKRAGESLLHTRDADCSLRQAANIGGAA
jgi:hypothetical protein